MGLRHGPAGRAGSGGGAPGRRLPRWRAEGGQRPRAREAAGDRLTENTMLNAAIVGLGWWGKEIVTAVQGKSKRLRFARGISKEADQVRDFAAEHGFALSTEFEDATKDPKIDAIVLA